MFKNYTGETMVKGLNSNVVVNEEFLKNVERLSRQGFFKKDIIKYYGIGKNRFYELMKKHPEIREAYRQGKNEAFDVATSKLWEAMNNGDLKAIMFYLKTRKNWGQTINHKFDPKSMKRGIELLKINTTDPVEASKVYQRIMSDSE